MTGASVLLSGGTWVAIGTVQVLGETAAAAYVDLRITDGSTHYGQGRVLTGSIGGNADYNPVPLICAPFVLASPTTIKLQANTGGGTGSTKVIRFGALTGAAPEPSRVVFVKLDGVTLGVAPSGCELHGSAQSGMTNSTPLIWNDPPVFDPDGYWNAAQPSRLTVPSGKGGRLFLVAASVEFNNPGGRRVSFYVNGAVAVIGAQTPVYIFAAVSILFLADGDYVDVREGDGNDDVITSDQIPYFSLAPVG